MWEIDDGTDVRFLGVRSSHWDLEPRRRRLPRRRQPSSSPGVSLTLFPTRALPSLSLRVPSQTQMTGRH